ncbi:MAG: hypothetical protein GXP38_12535 [Chloroflexi bacterium]|nr:hypothetical protein [Chloroflexota bacterium]
MFSFHNYVGFFHSDKYGRPALALDLEEEFRHIIVDSVVLRLVNRNMVAATDFEPGAGGVAPFDGVGTLWHDINGLFLYLKIDNGSKEAV